MTDRVSRRILCPTDGTEPSLNAVDCAIDLAKSTDSEITFLTINVVPRERAARERFWDSRVLSAIDRQIDRQLDAASRKAMARAFDNFECTTVTGNHVGDAIVAFAEAEACDHIVMGTGVTSDWQRFLNGSVSARVVQRAHCPVTVVH
jgi:nucleotide-binding universal stress UspA family protein